MARSAFRPRLSPHVLARRYVDGDDGCVIVFDTRTDAVMKVGEREWQILAAADGTRDRTGVLVAARREGVRVSESALGAFLDQAERAGIVEEGVEDVPPEPVENTFVAQRPLRFLPDFSLHCDGGGTCCRLYGSVVFSSVEAARARASCPGVLEGGERHDRVFLPQHGGDARTGAAVALVRGACAYLGDDARCSIHAAAGAEQKPLGCRIFPAWTIDDGEHVRVSVRPECACVLRSVGRTGGAPLLAGAPRVRSDLPAEMFVDVLPETVGVSMGASRAAFRAFSNAIFEASDPKCAVASLLGLASEIEAHGLRAGGALSAFAGPPRPDASMLRPMLEALHASASRRSRVDTTFRSEKDVALRSLLLVERACAELLGGTLEDALSGSNEPAKEAFVVRAVFFGYRFARDALIERSLRDRALRFVLARHLSRIFAAEGAPERALAEPIAVIEAVLEGHGLDDYARGG